MTSQTYYSERSDFYIRGLLSRLKDIRLVARKSGVSVHTLQAIYYKKTRRIFADTFGALEAAYESACVNQDEKIIKLFKEIEAIHEVDPEAYRKAKAIMDRLENETKTQKGRAV